MQLLQEEVVSLRPPWSAKAKPWGASPAPARAGARGLGTLPPVRRGTPGNKEQTMLDYMGPDERADAMCKAADEQRRAKLAETAAKIDAKALGRIAADMGLHDHQNRDSGAGLPLVMTGPDSTRRLDDLTGNGRTPGGQNDTASRTDAASSLTEKEAALKACEDVEGAAWRLLLASGLTWEHLEILSAFHRSVWATRSAQMDVHSARLDAMFARLIGGAK